MWNKFIVFRSLQGCCSRNFRTFNRCMGRLMGFRHLAVLYLKCPLQNIGLHNRSYFECTSSKRCCRWHRSVSLLDIVNNLGYVRPLSHTKVKDLRDSSLCVEQYRCVSSWVSKEFRDISLDLLNKYLQLLRNEFENLSSVSGSTVGSSDEQIRSRRRELEPIVMRYIAHEQKTDDIRQLNKILADSGNDKEVTKMAHDEISQLEQQLYDLEAQIAKLLVPDSVDDANDVILEVSAGVGGKEAMLFTKEILAMYMNYASSKGWATEMINYVDDIEAGGVRHATVIISGIGVYKALKFEGGVHRIQRVPKTEQRGRVHTSTMTVAILPQPAETDVYLNPRDLHIETCKASGKGGQHVNTTDSAVRVVHIPSGVSAECQTQRSQIKNKETALKMLSSRLYEMEQEKTTRQLHTSRKLQVGSANRNEKIRTYNVKDDRVTDHRLQKNLYGVEEFLSGSGASLDDLIQWLSSESKKEQLLEKLSASSSKNNSDRQTVNNVSSVR